MLSQCRWSSSTWTFPATWSERRAGSWGTTRKRKSGGDSIALLRTWASKWGRKPQFASQVQLFFFFFLFLFLLFFFPGLSLFFSRCRCKTRCAPPENVEPWGLRDFLCRFQEVHVWDQEAKWKGGPLCGWLGGTVRPVDQLFDCYLFPPLLSSFDLLPFFYYYAQRSKSRLGFTPWTRQRTASRFLWKTLSFSRSSERAPLARSCSVSRSALVASMRWKS